MTTETKVKIKPASLVLLDSLYEIERQSFREEAFTRSEIATMLNDCNVIAYIADIDGETAGFVIAAVDFADEKTFGHILTLDVLPRYRRKGIARQLLQTVETTLIEKGISECRLEVREDNTTATRLYLRMGYQKMGKLERYYGKRHGLYLRKLF